MTWSTTIDKFVALVLLTCITGCLGPNPRLEDCGEKWVIEADDAWYKVPKDDIYRRNCAYIDKDYECVLPRGELCLNRAQASNMLTDPNSLELATLQSKAIAHCKEVALAKNATWENCETGIGEPFYDGRCMLAADRCDGEGGVETGESTGGESETGDAAAPLVLDGISCNRDTCTIPAATVEALLAANDASLSADGTIVVPHADGLQLRGVQPGNLGAVLGFVDGDVVTEIDGAPIMGWDALVGAINRVLEAERVQLTVERDGRARTQMFVRTP